MAIEPLGCWSGAFQGCSQTHLRFQNYDNVDANSSYVKLVSTIMSMWLLWDNGLSNMSFQYNHMGRYCFQACRLTMSVSIEVMVSRMTLILYILQCKNVFYLYEQPGSSLLWSHPRMEDFISSVHAYRAWTWMGAFGAPSPKGTTLWSSRPAVQKMSRSLPAGKTWSDDITTRTVLKSGKPSVSGGKGLKESQAYTSQFGFATLSVWLEEDEWPEPEWLRSRFQTFGLHWLRKTGGMMHVFKKWCSISLPISLANQPWGVSQHCISTLACLSEIDDGCEFRTIALQSMHIQGLAKVMKCSLQISVAN